MSIVLSGMRPTGKLHIGHLEGVLGDWVRLQENNKCNYFVADWHAITTNSNTKEIKENTISMVKDWMAYGIDPDKSNIFIQSKISQHAELSLVFSMLVNLGRLEKLPTFNEYMKEVIKADEKDIKLYDEAKRANVNHGFLGYPILQAADILLYKTNLVPIGQDQIPHIELTRDIAKKFNNLYAEIFPVPDYVLGSTPKIIGFDGRKMSKSYGNALHPDDSIQSVMEKVRKMITDPQKLRKNDSGNPYVCSIYDLHEIFSESNKEIANECHDGARGCVDCKLELSKNLYEKYGEFREKRSKITDNTVMDALYEGTKRAQIIAQKTMDEVKDAMILDYRV